MDMQDGSDKSNRSVHVGGSSGVIVTGDRSTVNQTTNASEDSHSKRADSVEQINITKESIDGQLQLLDLYRQTLNIYLQQRAIAGTPFVQPSVIHGIGEARKAIRHIKSVLRGWNINVPDLPN